MTFATINKGHRAFARAMPAVTCKAWKIMDSGQCREIDPFPADTLDEAADYCAGQSIRGVRYAILMNDAGANKKTLRLVLIRKRQAGKRRWSHAVGGFVDDGATYADTLVELRVSSFDPERPFDAFRDDPVGIDRTLVEAKL